MNYQAVLFDMDGVLVDSEPGYHVANRAFFEQLGLSFGPREVSATTGATGPVIADLILHWKPDIPLDRQGLIDRYTDSIFAALKETVSSLVPGAYEWICRLHDAGVRLAIGSSSTYEMVRFVADRFGLTEKMDAIVTCGDVARGKPAPDIFSACCRQLSVSPGQALVIEDSRNGVRAAAAAGCPCAAFLGTNRYGIDVSEADFSFSAFDGESFLRLLGEPL